MITGNCESKIESYLPMDRCGEGYGFVEPWEGEEFIGIPYGWHTEISAPFIEVRKNGVVVRTINASDVSEIRFDQDVYLTCLMGERNV